MYLNAHFTRTDFLFLLKLKQKKEKQDGYYADVSVKGAKGWKKNVLQVLHCKIEQELECLLYLVGSVSFSTFIQQL